MSAPALDFKDLVVVITGAGGGIGKGYAHFFGARGAKVVINDVSAKSAQEAVDEIKQGECESEKARGDG